MLQAILFDLDDTLIGNSMDTFIPAYLGALSQHVSHKFSPQLFIDELRRATAAMDANDGTGPTNKETFDAVFFPALGHERAALEPLFDQFYAEEFPKLRPLMQQRPEARSLVEWAFARGLQVVIATNAIFPRSAIEQRIDWAGVPVTEFDYALVTTYENMHATKSHTAYYCEILDRIGRQPDECVMIGDNWDWDVARTAPVGIPAYWIAEPGQARPADDATPIGQGTLADFWAWVESGGLA